MPEPIDKFYASVQVEDHYTVVGEPGEYYLTHFSSDHGEGRTTALKIFNTITDTKLHDRLAVVGTDGILTLTGKNNGGIRNLEELLNKRNQWAVCLLLPMDYRCVISSHCLMEAQIVLTRLQDLLSTV